MDTIAPSTAKLQPDWYCVFGNPIAHSQSPLIHSEFAQRCGQSMVYERRLAPLDAFGAHVEQFFAQGGKGCNITLPFKVQALNWARSRKSHTQVSQRAKLAGACNTLSLIEGTLWADNTDGAGLVRDLQDNLGLSIKGQRIILLGAGGAAAGALGALIAQQPQAIYLFNRSLDKAQGLLQSHQAWAQEHGVALMAHALEVLTQLEISACQLLINASSSSLSGDTLAIPTRLLDKNAWVYDMMYGPSCEPFLQEAKALGLHTSDGLGMLVEQAAEAFHIWRGLRPPSAQVLASLRAQQQADTKGAPS